MNTMATVVLRRVRIIRREWWASGGMRRAVK